MARATSTPRLILVDGFAGTGKSTTAQRLWLDLTGRGREAAWFHEHQARHPIYTYDEVDELLDVRPGPFEEQLRARWTALVRASRAPAIRILEGSFFQLTVGVLVAMNVPAPRIERLLLDIDRILRPLDPRLVLLYYRDTRRGLLAIREHRGAYWLDGMTSIVGRSPYGRRHRVRDVGGLIDFYRAQRAIVDAVRPRLSMPTLAVEIGAGRWNAYLRRIRTFLGLPSARPLHLTSRQLLRRAGRYRNGTGERVVATDASDLYLHDGLLPPQPLLAARDGSLAVASLPITLTFTPRRGQASRLTIHNHLVAARPAKATFTR